MISRGYYTVNNVLASLQAQELQNRVLGQAIVQKNEEAYYLPQIYNAELKNRYPNRPSDSNPIFILSRISLFIAFGRTDLIW